MDRKRGELYTIVGIFFALILIFNVPSSSRESLRRRAIAFLLSSPQTVPESAPSAQGKEIKAHSTFPNREKKEASSRVSARVVFRDPVSWSNFLWIEYGKESPSFSPLIGEGSPVLCGECLVGVIERVAERFSSVRLLTDAKCIPSVTRLSKEHSSVLGEMHGAIKSLFRSYAPVLRGVNFHEGTLIETPTIKEGDVLMTSGLDGVFPRGLLVGRVSRVLGLEKGLCTYSLEAKTMVSDWNALLNVELLPSLFFKKPSPKGEFTSTEIREGSP